MVKRIISLFFEADPFTCKQYGDTLLKPYYWKPLFWSDSYFVTSVSENSLTNIKTYIQNQ